jgi:hypothetical protein
MSLFAASSFRIASMHEPVRQSEGELFCGLFLRELPQETPKPQFLNKSYDEHLHPSLPFPSYLPQKIRSWEFVHGSLCRFFVNEDINWISQTERNQIYVYSLTKKLISTKRLTTLLQSHITLNAQRQTEVRNIAGKSRLACMRWESKREDRTPSFPFFINLISTNF